MSGVSIDSCCCELGLRQSNPIPTGVKHGVESLHECLAQDEVQPLARRGAKLADDEIDTRRRPSNHRVETSWPQLSIWCEFEIRPFSCEEEALQIAELRVCDAQKSCCKVNNCPSCALITLEGICCNED